MAVFIDQIIVPASVQHPSISSPEDGALAPPNALQPCPLSTQSILSLGSQHLNQSFASILVGCLELTSLLLHEPIGGSLHARASRVHCCGCQLSMAAHGPWLASSDLIDQPHGAFSN